MIIVACRNCGNIVSDIVRDDYLENFPISADDWLRQLDRESGCCDNPDHTYETGDYYE